MGVTLPSSDPEHISESLKGFLPPFNTNAVRRSGEVYQSVSSTTAVWPLKSGIRSGSLPLSLVGITANAPPPLASQLTAMYSGLAWQPSQQQCFPGSVVVFTLTKFVSQAFFEILRLS